MVSTKLYIDFLLLDFNARLFLRTPLFSKIYYIEHNIIEKGFINLLEDLFTPIVILRCICNFLH